MKHRNLQSIRLFILYSPGNGQFGVGTRMVFISSSNRATFSGYLSARLTDSGVTVINHKLTAANVDTII